MTLQETLAFADSRIAAWWPMIQAVQAAYFQQHGRYAQALELVAPSYNWDIVEDLD